MATTDPIAPGADRPDDTSLGAVFGIRAFRGLWIANVLAALALGTSRFTFVWLIGDLTDWNPAVAVLGVVVGLPALLLSAQAGALADRLPPRRLGLALLWSTAATFAGTAVLVASPVMSVPVALACAFVTAVPVAGTTPLFQSLVPVVVPRSRLLQAVALQNMGMMSSMILGAFVGGGIIALTGVAGGFWALAAASALAAVAYGRIPLPAQAWGAGLARKGAVREALRVALGTEPLRSLLGVTFVVGMATAAVMLLLPAVARDVLEVGSFPAGLLNATMGVGLMATSLWVASRPAPSRPGLVLVVVMGSSLGTGLFLLGWSRSYALSLAITLVWGAAGGVTMALLRALLQEHTQPELMGRMMGLSALAQQGAFPLGSVVLFGLVRLAGLGPALMLAGVLCAAGIWAIGLFSPIRRI